MLIFIAPRLVMLSVPKTGTTALEATLAGRAEITFCSQPQIKHLTYRQYLNHIKPLLSPLGRPHFECLAVIREPLDWLRSWYSFRTRAEIIGKPNSTAPVSFERFLRDYLSEGTRPAYARLGRQSEFLKNSKGEVAVEHVFRYEAMPAVIDFLSDRLGMRIDLPRINVSPRAVTELSAEAEAMAREALAPEYAIWEAARQTGV